MKKTCAQLAKELEKQYNDGHAIPAGVFAYLEKFKECVDFPKEPEKVEFDIVCGDTVGVIEIKDPGNKIKNQLKGKRWKITATEQVDN